MWSWSLRFENHHPSSFYSSTSIVQRREISRVQNLEISRRWSKADKTSSYVSKKQNILGLHSVQKTKDPPDYEKKGLMNISCLFETRSINVVQ